MYTASTAFLEALTESGVDYIFANFGSDHPALIEAIADARAAGRPLPRVVTCPNEMVAMSAAHGYAQVSGRAQAVLVHVECGTQALAGAVHNAARARVPMLVYAGTSPFTQEGELPGSRNEFIQWLQDVHDQRGIVRGYMKYDAELRSGRNLKQMVSRALQISASAPRGPVYLVGAREVMEETIEARPATEQARWPVVAAQPLPAHALETILDAFDRAERPLVITSYAGRDPAAVDALAAFCATIGAGVLESCPSDLNFPADHPLYQGMQWNEPVQNTALAEADCVLVLDSDVPWIPTVNRPGDHVPVFHVDIDPLKESMPLWHIDARLVACANARTALDQLNAALAARAPDAGRVEARVQHFTEAGKRRRARLAEREENEADRLTPATLVAAVRERLDDDCIVLNEGITNYGVVGAHLGMTRPGSMFASGGGSLGWNGGAAIGAKLAAPDKTVVALGGDGCFMFSVPSTVHWLARRYDTPILQIVFNNGGWRAPRMSALGVRPDGRVSRTEDLDLSFEPAPEYAAIAAAAGGALGLTAHTPQALASALDEAFEAVRRGRCSAVIDARLAQD